MQTLKVPRSKLNKSRKKILNYKTLIRRLITRACETRTSSLRRKNGSRDKNQTNQCEKVISKIYYYREINK